MSIKTLDVGSDGYLSDTTHKTLLIAARGLIDAGIAAGILLEIPFFATPDDALSEISIFDVVHLLSITDAQKNLLCDLVRQELNIVDVNQTINVNDTVAYSVLCDTVNVNRVIVNSDPNGQVTEIDL